MATVKRNRGGNFGSQQEAIRRQLSAPVYSWKKEWVTPAGAPEETSFKVLKWVKTTQKVDLKRNLPSGSADDIEVDAEPEAEDLDDPNEAEDIDEDEEDGEESAVKAVVVGEAEGEGEDKMDVDGEDNGGGEGKPQAKPEAKVVPSEEEMAKETVMPGGIPALDGPTSDVVEGGSSTAMNQDPDHDTSRQKETMKDDSPMIIIEGTNSPARAPPSASTNTPHTPSGLSIPPLTASSASPGSPRRRKSPSPAPSPSRMTRARSRTPTPDPERIAHIGEQQEEIPPPEIPVSEEVDPRSIGNLPSPVVEKGEEQIGLSGQNSGSGSGSGSRMPSNAVEVKVAGGLAPQQVDTQFGETLSPAAIASLESDNETRDPNAFSLGTRASQLALIQTNLVASVLSAIHPSSGYTFPVVPMSVAGDRNKTSPLYLLSTSTSTVTPAKSLWTEELEDALIQGKLAAIVHSCKDVPTVLPERCELGAMLKREDPHDALIVKEGLGYKSLGELPAGSVVGTSSVRRIAQIRKHHPGLKVLDVRGNLDTRFRKLDDPAGPFAAIILAAAGVHRMDLSHRITSLITAPEMYHAVSQGAIAIEIRSGDERVKSMLRGAGDWETEWRVGCERGLLRELEGGCSVPVGVETALREVSQAEEASIPSAFDQEPTVPADADPLMHHSGFGRAASLHLKACVTSIDGTKQVVHDAGPILIKSWKQAEDWGHIVAKRLISEGADVILNEINALRQEREQQDLAKEAQNLAAPPAPGAPHMEFTNFTPIAHARAMEDNAEPATMEGVTNPAEPLGEGDPVGAGGEIEAQDEDFEQMEVDS